MLSLVNNMSAMTAENNLSNANNAMNTSLQRLSSGLQINSGADNPAGLVISQEQQAQMSGLQSAITNTSIATNVVQTADGALNETNSLLLQIRGLAVSAANSGANDSNMLAADQAQIANALQTITNIANSTQYGQDALLNGSHAVTASLQQAPTATVVASGTNETGNLSASATAGTTAGTYTATISALATQASIAGTADTIAAGTSEVLTIAGLNTVNIQLNGGLNGLGSQDVVNAINNYQSQTGVAASVNSSGDLVLTANAYGTAGNAYTVAESGSQVLGFTSTAEAFGTAGTAGTNVAGTMTAPDGSSVTVTGSGNVLSGGGVAITTDPNGLVAGAAVGSSNTGTISVNVQAGTPGAMSATAATNTAGGTYTADITQLATQATLEGSTNLAGQQVVGAGETDLLTINGVQVQLNGGTTGLNANGAAEAINQYSNQTGVTASVDTSTGGQYLKLTSTAYGSAQKINVEESGVTNPGNPSATIVGVGTGGLASATLTAGNDVAGTLKDSSGNVYETTGSGNVLTGANGLAITTDPTGSTGNLTTVVTNNSMLFQIGADAGQTATVSMQNMQANAIGTGVTNSSGIVNLSQIDVTNSNQSSADILSVIDQAISQVSNLAGTLGSFQDNTLQATAANLQSSLQNTTAANSTIRDTDFATESANFAQDQVLVQAGTQVLKDANQLPQLVLTLLQ